MKECSSKSCPLKIGVTSASLSLSGNLPDNIDLFIIDNRGFFYRNCYFFNRNGERLSYPVLCFVFKELIISSSWVILMGPKWNLLDIFLSRKLVTVLVPVYFILFARFPPIFAKKILDLSAISFGFCSFCVVTFFVMIPSWFFSSSTFSTKK